MEGRFKAGLLFAHAKMEPFNFGPRTLDLGHPDLRERGGEEDIVVSPRRIQMWDTPFGRLVVLICKDFLTVGVQETLLASRPDLILIPMMSGSCEARFMEFAGVMGSHCGTVVLAANSSFFAVIRGRPSQNHSMIAVPFKTREGQRLSRYIGYDPAEGNLGNPIFDVASPVE